MISSVSSLATQAVTVLAGQRRASVPVEPVAPVKIVKRRSGHTDDVFKAGDVIGSMIVIAAKLDQAARDGNEGVAGAVDETGAEPAPAETASGNIPSNTELQKRGMEAIQRHATGTGPLAEWARAYLEAQERPPR